MARLGDTVKSIVDNNFDDLNDKPTADKIADTARDVIQHLKKEHKDNAKEIKDFKKKMFENVKERAE